MAVFHVSENRSSSPK
jgi:hypothetical protein